MVNNKESLDQIENLLNSVAEIDTDYNNIVDLLSNEVLKDYSNKKKKITKKYDLNGTDKFNIFETISDKYKLENFHTDILFSILDPNTPEIGSICNDKILEKFVKMVDTSFKFTVDDTVKVSNQEFNIVFDGEKDKKGYTDLLITNNNNQAIIIENKINDARDTKNQLVRYMKYVWEEKFGKDISSDSEDFKENVRVVYLTLIPNGKKPNIEDYAPSFSPYTNLLQDAITGEDGDILKYRSAVDSKQAKPDLYKFLENCIKLFEGKNDEQHILKKIYLEQYKTLLGHLGGNATMDDVEKMLILEKIYSNKSLLDAAKVLYEIFSDWREQPTRYYDKTPNAVSKFFDEKLEKISQELGLEKETNGHKGYIKRKGEYVFYICGENMELEIGFGKKPNIDYEIFDDTKKRNKYKDILEKNGFNLTEQNNDRYVYSRTETFDERSGNIEVFLLNKKNTIEEIMKEFLAT